MAPTNALIPTSIAPWLSIQNGSKAVDFYKAAFNAVETYRYEAPDGGLVVKLSVNGSEFWISGRRSYDEVPDQPSLGSGTIRMILTVNNPDELFMQALAAGATTVFPVSEEQGWRLGRLVDPFGLHWEIGYQLPQV